MLFDDGVDVTPTDVLDHRATDGDGPFALDADDLEESGCGPFEVCAPSAADFSARSPSLTPPPGARSSELDGSSTLEAGLEQFTAMMSGLVPKRRC